MGNIRYRPTFATIDLKALSKNFMALKKLQKSSFICPMLKANAYGHGDVEVARALEKNKPSAFGVGLIEEAVRLRSAGIKSPILFFGAIDRSSVHALGEYSITPVISDWEQLELIKLVAKRKSVTIHLKINTGMQRYGFNYDMQTLQLLNEALNQLKNVKVDGIMTHLACGEDFSLKESFSRVQLRRFLDAYKTIPKLNKCLLHIFNTTGLISYSQSDLAHDVELGSRPGIGLYGYAPSLSWAVTHLQPILSLYSRIVHITRVKKGNSVSYGRSWTAKQNSIIGIVPIGYADGLPRALSNKGNVLISNQLAPVVGNVTMDNIMVDLTKISKIQGSDSLLGKDVILIGQDHGSNKILVSDWSKLTGTIEWEILTGISERVPRVFRGGHKL
jgi:alanine racemase